MTDFTMMYVCVVTITHKKEYVNDVERGGVSFTIIPVYIHAHNTTPIGYVNSTYVLI